MWPLTSRRERVHDLAHGRREDVHAADDQHVVGAADAADARARRGRTRTGSFATWTWSRVRKRRSGAARCRRCVRTSSPAAPSSSVERLAGARGRSARRGRSRARRGASRPAPRTRPRATGRCRRRPSPRSPSRPSPPRASRGRPARRRRARPRRGRARRSSRAGRVRSRPSRWAAYDGVSTTASGSERLDRAHERARVPGADRDVHEADARRRRASAAPATNGPAL